MDMNELKGCCVADCVYLHHFFSGKSSSSNPRKVVEILGRRNIETIKLIRQTYLAVFKHDLLELLPQEDQNLFARVAYLRASEQSERDAEIIRGALFATTVDLDILTEIICTRPSSEIASFKQAYQFKYQSSLERDVAAQTNGFIKEVLLALLNPNSSNGGNVETSTAQCDAKTLYEAIVSGRYTDQRSIIQVLTSKSTVQINETLASFKQLYGHELMKFLKKDKCGDFGKYLSTVVRGIQFPEKHFAKQLRRNLKKCDAREALIRTTITRSGIDIKYINRVFTAKTGWTLESLINNEFGSTSNYDDKNSNSIVGDFLIAIIKYS